MRKWIATALLAGSWLLGLGYLDPANTLAWGCMLVAAVLLLADTPMRLPERGVRSAVLLLLLAAVAFVPLPYNAIATILLIGTAASVAPIASRWLPRLARGAIAAGSMPHMPMSWSRTAV